MACTNLESIIEKFESFTQKPANYLTVQSGIREDVKNLVKSVYDFTKAEENSDKKKKKSTLPELIVQDFDEEQIWQEIELQNSECWDNFVKEVANCMSSKQDFVIPVKIGNMSDADEKGDSGPSDDDELYDSETEKPTKSKSKEIKQKKSKIDATEEGEENGDMESEKQHKKNHVKNRSKMDKKSKTSIVDDEFFKLSEMEKFLLNEEKKEGKQTAPDSDEESIPLFEETDDEGDKDMMYTDFFENEGNDESMENGDYKENDDFEEDDDDDDDDGEDIGNMDQEEMEHEMLDEQRNKKKDKKVRFADGSSDDDEEEDSEPEPTAENDKPGKYEKKSEFELRQKRLQEQISRLEDKTLSEAPWQLKGEVDASKRPQNSLLQEVVDFDLTTRPAPIITEQTTLTLEEIIIRRVKDKAWDDVVRKEKPVDDQLSFRKTEIIDQSKSKLSLAQVYEAEYLKQKQASSGEVEEEKEPEAHTQIRDAMNKLFAKLDALSHYHYTPKAPQAEVKIVSNTPAISMEEVAPVATSDAALLAPEEVKKKHRGDLMSKEERTQTDKNRERRKKKKLQRKKGQVTKVTDNRNTKKGVEASDKSLKTSKAFFQQLNDDSSSLIKNKRNVKNKGQ